MVNFIYDENNIEKAQKSAYPGNEIYYKTGFLNLNKVKGTIGFNAYYNGKWGVVTNGHVAEAGEKMHCEDGALNEPTFSTIGGKIDVAFVPYPSGWTATSGLKRDNAEIIYEVASSSEMVEGGLVTKYGVTTGKTMNGYITSTSVDVRIDYDGVVKTIRDCFSYSNPSEGGDSGGPVGRGGTRQVFRLLGIHVASGGTGIKLSNILERYPMTIKTGY